SASRVQATALANSRNASELVVIDLLRQPIAEAADGLDHVWRNLLSQAADEYLDGVGVAVEVLLVEMLDELGAGHHALVVMHQVGEQAVLVRGELDRLASERDPGGLGVEAQGPALEVALGVAGGATHLGTDARQQLL